MRLPLALAAASALIAAPASAVQIVIDYTYDTNHFFGAGNPSGATAGSQARASLDAAAAFFTDVLDDSFAAIESGCAALCTPSASACRISALPAISRQRTCQRKAVTSTCQSRWR